MRSKTDRRKAGNWTVSTYPSKFGKRCVAMPTPSGCDIAIATASPNAPVPAWTIGPPTTHASAWL